jgi:hypothetical protein
MKGTLKIIKTFKGLVKDNATENEALESSTKFSASPALSRASLLSKASLSSTGGEGEDNLCRTIINL